MTSSGNYRLSISLGIMLILGKCFSVKTCRNTEAKNLKEYIKKTEYLSFLNKDPNRLHEYQQQKFNLVMQLIDIISKVIFF